MINKDGVFLILAYGIRSFGRILQIKNTANGKNVNTYKPSNLCSLNVIYLCRPTCSHC